MSDRILLFTARPGQIYRTFIIPEELRKLPPFQARNHERYQTVVPNHMEGDGIS